MSLIDILMIIPLLSGVIWLSSVLLQVARLRIRTWTERFFVLGLCLAALYAFDDWLYFNVTAGNNSDQGALFLVRLSLSYLTFGILFFLLFMKAFHGRLKRADLVLIVPTLAMLAVCWTVLVRTVRPAYWGWKAVYDPLFFLVWVAYAMAYMTTGVIYIYRIARSLESESPRLGKKTRRIALLFVAMIAMGALTNALFQVAGLETPPLFSSLMIIPGTALLLVLSPLTKDRIVVFIKRWKARAYTVQHAFLVYENGTLIASKSKQDSAMVDRDIFAATLDAIQTFMRTSFPLLRGKWLKTIEHGDVRIILERGQRIYLAVVISGEENDQLRRMMKDVINAIESQNLSTLVEWSGVPEDIKGAREALGSLLKREDVF